VSVDVILEVDRVDVVVFVSSTQGDALNSSKGSCAGSCRTSCTSGSPMHLQEAATGRRPPFLGPACLDRLFSMLFKAVGACRGL
jgi:hypothetical protein